MQKPAFLAIIQQKCPRCRKGDVFLKPSYHPKFMEMHTYCQVCNCQYEVEPGFFWGSMYFNYAFSVAIGLILGFSTYYLLNDPAVWIYLTIIITALVILTPLFFRYSRILMLYAFSGIKYDPNKAYFEPYPKGTKSQ